MIIIKIIIMIIVNNNSNNDGDHQHIAYKKGEKQTGVTCVFSGDGGFASESVSNTNNNNNNNTSQPTGSGRQRFGLSQPS